MSRASPATAEINAPMARKVPNGSAYLSDSFFTRRIATPTIDPDIEESTIIAHANSSRAASIGDAPYRQYPTTNTAAVVSSTSGYIMENGAPHDRHFARSQA